MRFRNLSTPRRGEIVFRGLRNSETQERCRLALIKMHSFTAWAAARKYFRHDDCYNEELVGQALYLLVKCVNSLIGKEVEENFVVGAYIYNFVKKNLHQYLYKTQSYLGSYTTVQHSRKKGQEPPKVISMPFVPDVLTVRDQSSFMIREDLANCVTTEGERKVIKLLGQELNFAEIGLEIGLSRERVRQLVNNVRRKLIGYEGLTVSSRYKK